MAASDGGRTAYRGFEYQIDVTVWLLLEAFFVRNGEGSATVESDRDNDLEMDLSGVLVTSTIAVASETWICAIKTRRAKHWGYSELKEIVVGKAKSTREYPAATLAREPNARFIFVTEGAVSPDLQTLLDESENWRPKGGGTTKALKKLFPHRDRIAVRGQLTKAFIDERVPNILRRHLRVPESQCAEAHRALRDAVTARMRTPQPLTREELIRIASEHGGWPVKDRPKGFVEPSVWGELKSKLQQHHRLLILGEPGTGKSTAAEELMRELRNEQLPFEALQVFEPAALSRVRGRTVIWADDPFGQWTPGDPQQRRQWLTEFGKLKCGPDLKLIVTSRRGFAGDVGPEARLSDTVVNFDASFVDRERELLASHLEKHSAPPEVCAYLLSETNVEFISRKLDRPLAYDRFAFRVREWVRPSRSARNAALLAASDEAVADEVRQFLSAEPHEVRLGVLVLAWLLSLPQRGEQLEARSKQCQRLLDQVGNQEADVLRARTLLIERGWLADRAGHWGVALRDQQLKECLELANAHPAAARRIAASLRDGWARGGHSRWVQELLVEIAPELRDDDETLTKLATATTVPKVKDWYRAPRWTSPEWTTEFENVLRKDERTEPFLRGLVQSGLVHQGRLLEPVQREFVEFLSNLADLREAFLAAGRRRSDDSREAPFAIAYGYAKFVDCTTRLIEEAEAEFRRLCELPLLPGDDDDDDYVAHLESQDEARMDWPRALADGVIRREGAAFAIGRTEYVLWSELARLSHYSELQVDEKILRACPAQFIVLYCGWESSDASGVVLERIPTRHLVRAIKVRLGRQREADKRLVESVINSRFARAGEPEKVLLSHALASTPYQQELTSPAGKDALALLEDLSRSDMLSSSVVELLREVVALELGPTPTRAKLVLVNVDAGFAHALRHDVKDADQEIASTVLEFAHVVLEKGLRAELIGLGLNHRASKVRKAALEAARGVADGSITAAVIECALRDPTPSARVAAIAVLAAWGDVRSVETLTILCSDDSITPDYRRENIQPEYRIANTARAALDAMNAATVAD